MTTRREFLALTAGGLGASRYPRAWSPRAARDARDARPVPTLQQLRWQRDELAMFLHFGVNTFTDREWGDGREDPAIFAPTHLDARQWARTAHANGFKSMVLTAKHHDGFCLWPTRTTQHSVASSPWRAGHGDVVREFVHACHAEHLSAGLYLSPWDRNAPGYGDSPRYNDFYCEQLTELLTQYGPIQEVWFDGANGEGPNGKHQEYDWPRIWQLVRKLQPEAVIFSDAGPDIRWIGNENGQAAETNWSPVDPAVVPFPGASGDGVMQMLQHGDPAGTVWRPGECDVSIRPGWFNHPAEDGHVKSAEELVSLYFSSVGRNAKLLLNVPPTREGLLHDNDIARLVAMRARLGQLFDENLTQGRNWSWQTTAHGAIGELTLIGSSPVSMVDLGEDLASGQLVKSYTVEGHDGSKWRRLCRGTTIGYRKMDRFAPVRIHRVRVTIDDALDTPRRLRVHLY